MLGRIFAGAGLILLPFIFEVNTPEQIRLPKAKFLFVMAALYFAVHLGRKVNPALAIAYGYCVFSAYFSETIFPFEELLIFTAAISTSYWVKSPSDKELKYAFNLLEFAGLVCALYGLLQINGLDPIQSYQSWADIRPVALFGQQTLYGPFAVSAFAVSLFQRHGLRSAFLLVPIALIDSSFTFLSLGAVLAIWAYANLAKRYFLLGIACSLVVSLSFLSMPKQAQGDRLNDKGRFVLWGQTVELALRKPIFGHGLGSFRVIYPVFQDKGLRAANGIDESKLSPEAKKFIAKSEMIRAESGLFYSPHNEYLQVFFELGTVGLFLLAFLFAALHISFFTCLKTTETWILFAVFWVFAANSIGNFTPHLVPQGLLLLWAYVAMTTRNPPAILFWYGRSKEKSALSLQRNRVRCSPKLWQYF